MSDDRDAARQAAADRAEAKAEAAATRRRWLTLAEIVAIAGVVIAGLTLWNNWQGREDVRAARQAAQQDAERARDQFILHATVAKGGKSLVLARDDQHALGNVTVAFPRQLGVAPHPAYAQTIDASWFNDQLLKLTDGGSDDRAGLLPVLVTYQYWVDDAEHVKRDIYDIVWKSEGRFLRGRDIRLLDMRLHRIGGSQAALDAAWAKEKPKAAGK